MALKYSKMEGVLRWSGGTTLLKRGTSVEADHPLAKERPDLFTDEEPDAKFATAPTVERATAAPGEVRTTPGVGPRGNRVPRTASGQ